MDKKINRAIESLEKVTDKLYESHSITWQERLEIHKGLDRLSLSLLKGDINYDKKKEKILARGRLVEA